MRNIIISLVLTFGTMFVNAEVPRFVDQLSQEDFTPISAQSSDIEAQIANLHGDIKDWARVI